MAEMAERWRDCGNEVACNYSGAEVQPCKSSRAEGDACQRRGIYFPARPDDLRRAVRQQRMAAGIAEAGDQIDVGQRGAGQPEIRAEKRSGAQSDFARRR